MDDKVASRKALSGGGSLCVTKTVVAAFVGKRGKSVGAHMQHTLVAGMTATEFRHVLTVELVMVQMWTESAHTFAPLTFVAGNALEFNDLVTSVLFAI